MTTRVPWNSEKRGQGRGEVEFRNVFLALFA